MARRIFDMGRGWRQPGRVPNPFITQADLHAAMPDYMREYLAEWPMPPHVLPLGPRRAGKTAAIRELAYRNGAEIFMTSSDRSEWQSYNYGMDFEITGHMGEGAALGPDVMGNNGFYEEMRAIYQDGMRFADELTGPAWRWRYTGREPGSNWTAMKRHWADVRAGRAAPPHQRRGVAWTVIDEAADLNALTPQEWAALAPFAVMDPPPADDEPDEPVDLHPQWAPPGWEY